MLSISKSRRGPACADYYLNLAIEDYYTSGKESIEGPAYWQGRGAEWFGLHDQVDRQTLNHLLQGMSPDGSGELVQNAGHEHRQCAWDLTFNAPKTVSVLWGLSSPDVSLEIEHIQKESVHAALAKMEERVGMTRRGKGGAIQERAALTYAVFQHGSSRALDPHLHSHSLLVNVGVRADGTTGALKTVQVFREKMKVGLIYRKELARRLMESFKVQIAFEKNGFRVFGVPQKLCREFSKRRRMIEKKMQEQGRSGAIQAKLVTLETRPDKILVPREELLNQWRKTAQAFGWSTEQAMELLHRQPMSRRTDGAADGTSPLHGLARGQAEGPTPSASHDANRAPDNQENAKPERPVDDALMKVRKPSAQKSGIARTDAIKNEQCASEPLVHASTTHNRKNHPTANPPQNSSVQRQKKLHHPIASDSARAMDRAFNLTTSGGQLTLHLDEIEAMRFKALTAERDARPKPQRKLKKQETQTTNLRRKREPVRQSGQNPSAGVSQIQRSPEPTQSAQVADQSETARSEVLTANQPSGDPQGQPQSNQKEIQSKEGLHKQQQADTASPNTVATVFPIQPPAEGLQDRPVIEQINDKRPDAQNAAHSPEAPRPLASEQQQNHRKDRSEEKRSDMPVADKTASAHSQIQRPDQALQSQHRNPSKTPSISKSVDCPSVDADVGAEKEVIARAVEKLPQTERKEDKSRMAAAREAAEQKSARQSEHADRRAQNNANRQAVSHDQPKKAKEHHRRQSTKTAPQKKSESSSQRRAKVAALLNQGAEAGERRNDQKHSQKQQTRGDGHSSQQRQGARQRPQPQESNGASIGVKVGWHRLFPKAPFWSLASLVKVPGIDFPLPQPRWGDVHWEKTYRFLRISVQDRMVSPDAPKWSPFHGLKHRAIRFTIPKEMMESQPRWWTISWKKDLRFGELRVQERNLFPHAPQWSPFHGIKHKALHLTTKKSEWTQEKQNQWNSWQSHSH